MQPSRRANAAACARIRELWGTATSGAIGRIVGVTAPEVKAAAERMGLGPNPYRVTVVAQIRPDLPGGFSAESLAWAQTHPGRDAVLILGMLGLIDGMPADRAAKGMAK